MVAGSCAAFRVLRRILAVCRYEVRKKKTNKADGCIQDMAELIASKFAVNGRVQCGIVYCLSKHDCEKVAVELQVIQNPSCSI